MTVPIGSVNPDSAAIETAFITFAIAIVIYPITGFCRWLARLRAIDTNVLAGRATRCCACTTASHVLTLATVLAVTIGIDKFDITGSDSTFAANTGGDNVGQDAGATTYSAITGIRFEVDTESTTGRLVPTIHGVCA